MAEPELDRLSNIVREFNDLWGATEFKDKDKVHRTLEEDLPAKVVTDRAYQNAMKNSDEQNAKIELEAALDRAMNDMVYDNMELYKLFVDNPAFKRWLGDRIFTATYEAA